MKALLGVSLLVFPALAEIHVMTLRQALDTALAQNPDVVLARLDLKRSGEQTGVLRDPFSVKLGVGSGLAGTYGFPQSIGNNAPAILQARGERAVFDRPASYRLQQAAEVQRGAELDIGLRQEEVAYRVYAAFLDAEQAARSANAAQAELNSLERIAQLAAASVAEGRALAITAREASVDTRRAALALANFRRAQTEAEITLAQLLGLPPGDQVRPAAEERAPLQVAASEAEVIEQALAASREVRRLESNIAAKQLEIKSYQSERLPKINFIGTYQLLSRINNYDEFYGRFQRHNAQAGISFELPLFVGSAAQASAALAEIDIEKLRVEINRTRSRIAADVRRAYAEVARAEAERDLAREDLEVARERVSLDLTQFELGRATMAQLEASRAREQQKWVAYYQAQHALETARLNVLRGSGTLLTALR